jgi:hypothetical protein
MKNAGINGKIFCFILKTSSNIENNFSKGVKGSIPLTPVVSHYQTFLPKRASSPPPLDR